MNKMELLKKLNALAKDNRGNSNERESAEKRLNELMKKYDIKIEDIEKEEEKDRYIEFTNIYERQLISQIVYKLFKRTKDVRGYISQRSKFKRTHLIVSMTDAEFIEFEYLYSVYKADLQKDMDLFYAAFINKNHIFPKYTDEELEAMENIPDEYTRGDRIRIDLMSRGIEISQIRKQIGGFNDGTSIKN